MLAEKKTWTYINHIQKIVSSYNYSVHRSTGIAPAKVNAKNQAVVLTRLNKNIGKQEKKPKFKLHEKTRVSIEKMPFQKGYSQSFTDEVYTVARITKQPPHFPVLPTDGGGGSSEGGLLFASISTYFAELVRESISSLNNGKLCQNISLHSERRSECWVNTP